MNTLLDKITLAFCVVAFFFMLAIMNETLQDIAAAIEALKEIPK